MFDLSKKHHQHIIILKIIYTSQYIGGIVSPMSYQESFVFFLGSTMSQLQCGERGGVRDR